MSYNPILSLFIFCPEFQEKLLYVDYYNPFYLPLPHSGIQPHAFCPMDQFSFSRNMCKLNHTVCGLLSLTSFTQYNYFKVHQCCYVNNPFLFIAEQYLIVQIYYSLLNCSSVVGHLSCFQFLAIPNIAALNICVHFFVWIYFLSS